MEFRVFTHHSAAFCPLYGQLFDMQLYGRGSGDGDVARSGVLHDSGTHEHGSLGGVSLNHSVFSENELGETSGGIATCRISTFPIPFWSVRQVPLSARTFLIA